MLLGTWGEWEAVDTSPRSSGNLTSCHSSFIALFPHHVHPQKLFLTNLLSCISTSPFRTWHVDQYQSCPNWVLSLLIFWVIILYLMALLKSTERIVLNIAPPSLPFTWFIINILLKQVFVLLIKDFVFSKFYSFIFSGLSWKTLLWVSRSTFSWGMNSNHGLCCQGTCISFSYVHEIVPLWCFLFSVFKTVVISCP